MADTGKIATGGFGAGAIEYVVLGGFVPSGPIGPSTLLPCIASLGFGLNSITRVVLLGFVMPGVVPIALPPGCVVTGFGDGSVSLSGGCSPTDMTRRLMYGGSAAELVDYEPS